MKSNDEMTKSKILGQFFTPEIVATFMAEWVCANNPNSILDPGIGHCALTNACHQINPDALITGYDIDDEISQYIADNISYSIIMKNQDYLLDWGAKYDGIICNPPYNKFQTIDNRDSLRSLFQKKMGVKPSGYTNILGYFLIKSISELKDKGRSAYIIPYEFLNTGYGTVIKKYILKQRVLNSIIKFDNSKGIFDEVITTTCILLLKKDDNKCVSFIEISDSNSLNSIDLSKINQYGIVKNYSELNPEEKWLKYFEKDTTKVVSSNMIKLSKIGKVMRGIATGDNNYFALNIETINKLGLSEECLVPCICKSSDIQTAIFCYEDYEKLVKDNKKTFLFNGCKAKNEKDFAYIRYGEEHGVCDKYLTSHRNPWFLIENKKIAPILIGVFNRDGLKIIRNKASISNLTTFHGLHLKTKYNNEMDINVLFCYLFSDVSKQLLFDNKREYGNQLDKFEPNDLNEVFILNPDLISVADKQKITKIMDDYLFDSDEIKFRTTLNDIFTPYVDGTIGELIIIKRDRQ